MRGHFASVVAVVALVCLAAVLMVEATPLAATSSSPLLRNALFRRQVAAALAETPDDVPVHVAAMIAQDRLVYMKPAMAAAAEAVRNLTRLPLGQLQHPRLKAIPAAAVYDPEVSMKMLWHSTAAYCDHNQALEEWTCNACKEFGPFTVTGVMDDGSNQGYVGYFTQGLPSSPINDGTDRVSAAEPFVVIAFRGTVPALIANWVENLSFNQLDVWHALYPEVKVHEGFWASYMNLKPQLLNALDMALAKSGAKTILVAGHSLGGGMAELAAIDLKTTAQYSQYHYASYTQGCPRIGNAAFAALLGSVLDVSFRDVHARDIVPHLPPLAFGFVHGPIEIWWDANDVGPNAKYQKCVSSMTGEDPNCSDSLLLPISIPNHLTYRGVHIGAYCGAKS